MTSLTINPLVSGTLSSKIKTYSIASTYLLFSLLALCQITSAQNIQPRPVARLVSDPAIVVAHSRPRRATTAEVHPAAADTYSLASPSIAEARLYVSAAAGCTSAEVH